MRSSFRPIVVTVALAFPAFSCFPVPVGVGVTIPIAPAPAPVVVVPGQGQGLEWNVNRNGSDYRSFDLGAPQPELCRSACMNDPACAAFTYVHPGHQGPNARCWLKNRVPSPNADRYCVSGVK